MGHGAVADAAHGVFSGQLVVDALGVVVFGEGVVVGFVEVFEFWGSHFL